MFVGHKKARWKDEYRDKHDWNCPQQIIPCFHKIMDFQSTEKRLTKTSIISLGNLNYDELFLLGFVLYFTLFMKKKMFVILNFIIVLYVFYGVELLIPVQFMLFQLNYWSYFFSANSYSPIVVEGLYNCIYNIGWT
jgi:hypothetical protein